MAFVSAFPGLALLPTLTYRPAAQRRPRARAVIVAGPGAEFSPDQLHAGLQRQLADSARAGQHSSPLHRNWVGGLPGASARHKATGQARQGWTFPAPSADLTSDQLRSGLERQLAHSARTKATQQATAAGAAVDLEAEADLKRRQLAARKWITPWLDQQARKRSVQAQAHLRQRAPLMRADEERAALQRQLLESGGAGGQGFPQAPSARPRRRLRSVPGLAASQDPEASIRSVDVQAQLRQRVALMSVDEERAALRRQLLASTSSMDGEDTQTMTTTTIEEAPAPPAPTRPAKDTVFSLFPIFAPQTLLLAPAY